MDRSTWFAILDIEQSTEDSVRVVNRTRGTVVGDRVRTARTFLSRLVGLLGTAAIADGEGLWIVPCRSVHTLGMRYPIDVAFLDARGALELRSGILAATGTVPGDRFEFEGGGPA
jgi:uncharacterized protein